MRIAGGRDRIRVPNLALAVMDDCLATTSLAQGILGRLFCRPLRAVR
jgi:hypothetical protein